MPWPRTHSCSCALSSVHASTHWRKRRGEVLRPNKIQSKFEFGGRPVLSVWEGEGQVALRPGCRPCPWGPSCSPEEQGCLLAEQNPRSPSFTATGSRHGLPSPLLGWGGDSLWSRPVRAPCPHNEPRPSQHQSHLLRSWNQVTN